MIRMLDALALLGIAAAVFVATSFPVWLLAACAIGFAHALVDVLACIRDELAELRKEVV